jgi:CrcB protein
MNLLALTVAGAIGCVVRYVFEYAVRRHHPTQRPWATVAANALGCGIAGWAAYRLVGSADVDARNIVLTGFCGGLTTFSSAFAIPAILVREHHWRYSVALVIATPLFCSALFVIGVAIAR